MTWNFIAGFLCGALLFDVMWKIIFYKWMQLYDRQQEHMEFLRDQLFLEEDE